jgi:hypothetical protein
MVFIFCKLLTLSQTAGLGSVFHRPHPEKVPTETENVDINHFNHQCSLPVSILCARKAFLTGPLMRL